MIYFCLSPAVGHCFDETNVYFKRSQWLEDDTAIKSVGTANFRKAWISLLTVYSTDTHFYTLTTDGFSKHCGKRRNCS